MSNIPKTLIQLAGANPNPATISDSILLLIDFQKEYSEGQLQISNWKKVSAHAKALLETYRAHQAPVIHIVHHSHTSAALFNPNTLYVDEFAELDPVIEEAVIAKTLPNAFAGTDLEQQIRETGRNNLVIVGFMTHMCVSSTVRAAIDLGFSNTIVANACGTRDLWDPSGRSVVPANVVHSSAIAELADRFATIVSNPKEIMSQ